MFSFHEKAAIGDEGNLDLSNWKMYVNLVFMSVLEIGTRYLPNGGEFAQLTSHGDR